MTEKPILFSTEMVQAIQAGRKTKTRRVAKPQPVPPIAHLIDNLAPWKKGDLLYVRETWDAQERFMGGADPDGADWADDMSTIVFKADGVAPHFKWRPSIHMPKAVARIWLRVVGVGVERVQEISEEDAKAEGVHPYEYEGRHGETLPAFVPAFMELWDYLNANRGYGWDANPWVWVVEFERTEKPCASQAIAPPL